VVGRLRLLDLRLSIARRRFSFSCARCWALIGSSCTCTQRVMSRSFHASPCLSLLSPLAPSLPSARSLYVPPIAHFGHVSPTLRCCRKDGAGGRHTTEAASDGGRAGEHAIRRQAHTSSSASPSMRTGSKSRRPGGEHAPPTFDKSSRRSSSISTSSICAHSHSSSSDWHRARMRTRMRELARSECH
jgi:hypothetical protein